MARIKKDLIVSLHGFQINGKLDKNYTCRCFFKQSDQIFNYQTITIAFY